LRVVKLHKERGMHFHLLLTKGFPVRRMLALAWPYKFGKVDVRRADLGAGQYLAKYLTKSYKSQNTMARRRRWGAFGGFKPCRCCDLEIISSYTRNAILLHSKTGGLCPKNKRQMLREFSLLGDYANWPVHFQQLYHASPGTNAAPPRSGGAVVVPLSCYSSITLANLGPGVGHN